MIGVWWRTEIIITDALARLPAFVADFRGQDMSVAIGIPKVGA